MAKVGRKPFSDPTVEFRLRLPQSLVAQVDLMLYDPTTGKVEYAGRGRYIEALIRRDLEERKARK